tara:strand:+ start:922 stop:1239 length:318 start_codon:yes stop_codon:yes gene_type:complete
MMKKFKEGELVKIISHDGWTVCLPNKSFPDTLTTQFLKERLLNHIGNHKNDDAIYTSLLGGLALITKVIKNHLDQTTSLEVLIDGRRLNCKAIVAEKYFEVVKNE